MATLVYEGGATLTFGSGPRRRTVTAGEPFEVDADLARILLADPQVRAATPGDIPRGMPARQSGPLSTTDLPAGATRGDDGGATGLDAYRALKARAKELGLPATGKAIDIEAAIAATEKRLADEATDASSSGESDQEGDAQPADDPGASASGEAGTPPTAGPSTGGAIVLGDETAGS